MSCTSCSRASLCFLFAVIINFSNFELIRKKFWIEKKMSKIFVSAKLLQLMEFNRITRIFVTILQQSGPQLAAFFLMFVVIFLGFSLGGNLLFGRVLRNYSTIIRSLQECGSMLLGSHNIPVTTLDDFFHCKNLARSFWTLIQSSCSILQYVLLYLHFFQILSRFSSLTMSCKILAKLLLKHTTCKIFMIFASSCK